MIYDKTNFNGWSLPEEAFDWIIDNIKIGSTIVELGSGNATFELVKFYNVYSVEQNSEWMYRVPQSRYIYAPLKRYENILNGSIGWFDEKLVFDLLPLTYSLLIIDGPVGIDRGNFTLFCHKFNKDVPFLIDDTNRDIDRNMALSVAEKLGKTVHEFKGHEKDFIILK